MSNAALVLKLLERMLPRALVFGLILFGAAGRVDVATFWAYLGLWLGYFVVAYASADPSLVRERVGPREDHDGISRKLGPLVGLAHLVVAGLDVGRYGWTSVAVAIQLAGFVVLVAAMALIVWTYRTNRFASSAVRVQDERHQRVIASGPYAFVRHPMYAAIMLVLVASGLALGSWLAALVMTPGLVLITRRTVLEDRLLHDRLVGYRDYAARTRWRVIPGLF